MRKRILAGILSLVMVLSLLPVSALAAEGPGEETAPVCAALESCGEDAHGEGCPLYVAPDHSEDGDADAQVGEIPVDPVAGSEDDPTAIDPEETSAGAQLNGLNAILSVAATAAEEVVRVSTVDELKTAFDNASDGDTIRLEADIGSDTDPLEGILVRKKITITLDLNGHTISGTGLSNQKFVLGVAGGVILTVKDSSGTSEGTITGGETAKRVVLNQGIFHLESGKVYAEKNSGIDVGLNGTATIAEGAVVKTDDTSTNGRAVSVSKDCSLTTAGEIASKCIGIFTQGGNVRVNDGTIDAAQYGVYIATGGSVTVSDGTIHSDDYGIYAISSSVNIKGGTVDASAGKYGVYTYNKASFNMSDGKIKGGSQAGVCIYWGGTHTVSGGTITGSYGITVWGNQELDINKEPTGVEPYGKTTLTVSGGTITGQYVGVSGNARRDGGYSRGGTVINIKGDANIEGVEGTGIYHPQDGDLNIGGGTIKGVSGVEIRGGNLTMTGGAITSTAASLSVTLDGANTTVLGAGIAVTQHQEQQEIDVSISDGTITGCVSFYEEDSLVENKKPVLPEKIKLAITGGNFVSTGHSSAFSRHKKEFITGGMYSKPVGKYTDSGATVDHLGSLSWDEKENKNIPSVLTQEKFTGKVHCVKVENDRKLPYHVGYLTGTGYDIEELPVGENSDPLVPTYSLNGNLVKGDDGAKGEIIHAAKVDVSDVNVIKSLDETNPVITNWASGNPGVATVDQNGVVTAVSASHDPVTITATLLNGETVPFFVTVVPKTTTINPPYKIEHYQEQLDDSYKLVTADTQMLFGKINETVTAEPNAYDHYQFDKNVNGTVQSGTVVMPTAVVDGEPNILKLKLYYKLDTHTLEYNLDSGTGTGYDSVTAKYGAAITIAAAPTKDGYKFTGWSDGSGNTYQPGTSLTITGNTTLTAQWSIDTSKTYTVTYDLGTGNPQGSQIQSVQGGGTATEFAPNYWEDHVFDGWYGDEAKTVPYNFNTPIT